MSRSSFSILLMGGVAAGALIGAPALAQDGPEVAQLDEIIVTAQLREQAANDIPFALTAYSGEMLENLGVQDFEELSAFTPGFLVQNQSPNNPGFVMRGITSDSGDATAEPRVSVFQDGVSISKSRGSYVELFDIARVEVAKGPQSTLYGRGALIGAVNIIQNRADLSGPEAAARLSVGNLDYRMAEFMANMPLGEDAAIRFATRLKSRNGYVENLLGGADYNGFDTQAFRLSGVWRPTETLRLDLIANYQQDDAPGTSFKSIAYSPADPMTGAILGGRAPWEGAALTPNSGIDGGVGLGLNREVWGVTGIGRLDLNDSLTLNATTAYREFSSYEAFDPDGISLPLLSAVEDAEGTQWSQEFRLNWDNGGPVTGFFGVGYFRERANTRVPLMIDERIALAQIAGMLDGSPTTVGTTALPFSVLTSSAVLDPILGGFGLPAPAVLGIRSNLKAAHLETATNSSELESFDLFGDLTWAVSDRLELSAGLRWTQDDKTSGIASSVGAGRSILGGLMAVQQLQGRITALIAQGTPAALAEAGALGVYVNGLVTQLATPGAVTAPVSAAFPLFGLTYQPTAGNGSTVRQDLEDDGFTWRLTARYELTDDVNVYANYARGRRPAVLAVGTPSTPLGAPNFTYVDAEIVDSYEIGAKANMGALAVDGAVYFYDYTNFQTTIQVGTQFLPANAGEATSYGFEGQARWAANEALDLFATYAFNHSRFETGLFEGNRFRLSPDHRASVGLTWRIPAGNGRFEIQPTWSWQSKMFFDNENDIPALQISNLVPDLAQDEFQEAYGLLNLRARYVGADDAWSLEVFADNLLDEEFIKDAGNTGDSLGLPTFIAGEPRTFGVTFGLRY